MWTCCMRRSKKKTCNKYNLFEKRRAQNGLWLKGQSFSFSLSLVLNEHRFHGIVQKVTSSQLSIESAQEAPYLFPILLFQKSKKSQMSCSVEHGADDSCACYLVANQLTSLALFCYCVHITCLLTLTFIYYFPLYGPSLWFPKYTESCSSYQKIGQNLKILNKKYQLFGITCQCLFYNWLHFIQHHNHAWLAKWFFLLLPFEKLQTDCSIFISCIFLFTSELGLVVIVSI